MAWYRKPARVNLGRYVAPKHFPEASVDELVEEGVLLSSAAVRTAVRNLVVLGSLRDGTDVSETFCIAAVRRELLDLAAEKGADADRIAAQVEVARTRVGEASHQSDYHAGDVGALTRRQLSAQGLADRLRVLSADDAFTTGLARRAHEAAWEDVAASLEVQLNATVVDDAEYRRFRDDRLLAVIGDLADLAAEHAAREDSPAD